MTVYIDRLFAARGGVDPASPTDFISNLFWEIADDGAAPVYWFMDSSGIN